MNKLLSLAAITSVLSIVSCSKENSKSPEPIQKPTVSSNQNVPMVGPKYRMVWHYDPWRVTCLPVSENCHPVDIIIKGESQGLEQVQGLFAVAETQNNDNIRSYMEANRADLSAVIPEEWVDAGIQGTYDVRYQFSTENNTHFLYFKTGDEIIMAFPIIEEA